MPQAYKPQHAEKISPADAVMVSAEGSEGVSEGGSSGGCEEGIDVDLGLRGTDNRALLRAACLTLSCSSAASAA